MRSLVRTAKLCQTSSTILHTALQPINVPFIEGVHKPEYACLNAQGEKYCSHSFSVRACQQEQFLYQVNHSQSVNFLPFEPRQTQMSLELYISVNSARAALCEGRRLHYARACCCQHSHSSFHEELMPPMHAELLQTQIFTTLTFEENQIQLTVLPSYIPNSQP